MGGRCRGKNYDKYSGAGIKGVAYGFYGSVDWGGTGSVSKSQKDSFEFKNQLVGAVWGKRGGEKDQEGGKLEG